MRPFIKLLILTAWASAATLASAQVGQASGKQGQRGGCRLEVQEICGSFRGQPEQMQACVTENLQEFSQACQSRLANKDWSRRGPRGKQGRGICRQQIDQACGEFRGQYESMQLCLQEHLATFSEFCQNKVKKRLESSPKAPQK